MAATFTHGTVGKYRGHWRGRITQIEEGGARHNLTKMLKDADGSPIPCEDKGNKGKNAAIAALTRWRDELLAAEGEAEAAEARSASLSGVTVSDTSRHTWAVS